VDYLNPGHIKASIRPGAVHFLASAEAGVVEETRAADRLGRLECAGLADPASGHAPVGGDEDASADVRMLWTAPLTEAAFDGGPPFAHSPIGRSGN
jgi:hypothetical protein